MGAFGLAFVTRVAQTLGVTGLPSPVTDANWDGWFVHQFFNQRFTISTAVGTVNSAFGDGFEVDSKAMRKFDGEDGLVMVAENANASHGFIIAPLIRFLIKAG